MTPTPPTPLTRPVLLLVEGKEDARFLAALTRHLGLENIHVEDVGGWTNFAPNLKGLKQRAGFRTTVTTLAVVRDANSNPQGAFQSVCSALRGAGFPEPRAPLQPVGESPRVNVMILPAGDTTTPGMLEDVCLQSVATDAPMLCVSQYFECLQQQESALPPGEMSKARIQVYLAAREPELRLGEAAEAGYWDWDHEAFEQAKAFLQQIAS